MGVVREAWQPGLSGELPAELEAGLAPGSEDPVRDPQRGDVVEHQRDDDLVHAAEGLQDAGDRGVGRAGEHAGDHHERDRDDRRRPRRHDGDEDDRRGAPGAHQELALGADVPQAHPECERTRQAGEDQWRRRDQGVGQDAEAPERRPKDVDEDRDRITAGDPQDDAADEEGDDDGADRGHDRQPAGDLEPPLHVDGPRHERRPTRPPRRAAGGHGTILVASPGSTIRDAVPPVINRPISATSASAASKRPTRRPS